MKKDTSALRQKKVSELEKQASSIYEELLKLNLSKKSSPVKDTNVIFKKRKQLAVILTLITEKKELEKINKVK
ncbi:MAG: hypothetical protein UR68_C0022G0004 [Candidatus Roizmanbacteria bacterium GW2011_GWA2_35_19]|uniref:Large ribosomal subunit protein uL29 n=2 Tax=Candidatus Roizmaniibacteriota TaxID=1752723 RepID=A0A0G0C792_9BACT|nr:MAG: hypothetical protein UR63_C0042G0004 [Candidatus Roizmanbacteria bacterium GW2011_GWC2_35_12]KKP72021.1 MAG: hypothetical protein UR68_C0022G0004 [Candidatus Roizmanbacteria bacterium GW2011_GWA2_35_19]